MLLSLQVSWEVVPNGTAALRSFAGLLLAGTAGPAVTVASPRPGTAGFALTFPGGSGMSCVPVESQHFFFLAGVS